jgi:hypothetical protein
LCDATAHARLCLRLRLWLWWVPEKVPEKVHLGPTLWWGCDVVSQLVKPLQMTAELEVEALRDILRDLVQLCHHLTHDVTTRTHDQKLMVFSFFGVHLGKNPQKEGADFPWTW